VTFGERPSGTAPRQQRQSFGPTCS
jgi:hypothetical protein